jgi:hypothetical protein
MFTPVQSGEQQVSAAISLSFPIVKKGGAASSFLCSQPWMIASFKLSHVARCGSGTI